MAHCLLLVIHCFVCSSTSLLHTGSQKPTRSSLYINYFDKNKNMRPGTDILHPTNLACLGPLARKRRFHRTSWRLPPSTHDATFSHITTAHEAREAGEAPSALTVYCITRVGVGANIAKHQSRSVLTFTHPTLPPQEHYKGRYFPSIDLLRWAENRLLQSVFTLHRMKCGVRERTIAARVFHLSTLALPHIFCYNTRVGRLAHLARALH